MLLLCVCDNHKDQKLAKFVKMRACFFEETFCKCMRMPADWGLDISSRICAHAYLCVRIFVCIHVCEWMWMTLLTEGFFSALQGIDFAVLPS